MAIDATPDQVWRAITDPGLVEQWMMGARVDSTWRKGEPITWSGEYSGPAYTVTWSLGETGKNKTEPVSPRAPAR